MQGTQIFPVGLRAKVSRQVVQPPDIVEQNKQLGRNRLHCTHIKDELNPKYDLQFMH